MADVNATLELLEAHLFSDDEGQGEDNAAAEEELLDFGGEGILDDLLGDLEPSVEDNQQIVSVSQEYERPLWPLAESGQFVGQSAYGGPLFRKEFVSDFIQIRKFKETCLAQLQDIQVDVDAELGFAATPTDVSCDSVQEQPIEQTLHELLQADLEALYAGGRAGDTMKRSPFSQTRRKDTLPRHQADATGASSAAARSDQAERPLVEELSQPLDLSLDAEMGLQNDTFQAEDDRGQAKHPIINLSDLLGTSAEAVLNEGGLRRSEAAICDSTLGTGQELDHESVARILAAAGLEGNLSVKEPSLDVQIPAQEALGLETRQTVQQPNAEPLLLKQPEDTPALGTRQLGRAATTAPSNVLEGLTLIPEETQTNVLEGLTLTPEETQTAAGDAMETEPTGWVSVEAGGRVAGSVGEDTGAVNRARTVAEGARERTEREENGRKETEREETERKEMEREETKREETEWKERERTEEQRKEKGRKEKERQERSEQQRIEKQRKKARAEEKKRRGLKSGAEPPPSSWAENEVTQSWVQQLGAYREYRAAMRNEAPLQCIRETPSDQRASIIHKKTHQFTPDEAFPPWLNPVPNEAIVIVRVFDPSNRMNAGYQEHLVLGSQRLTQFRDRILCPLDTLAQAAGVNNPSGYFLIEETFFDDMRKGAFATRYSTPIVEWAAAQRPPPGATAPGSVCYGQENMEQFVFEDLNVRVGAEYLYCHQGNCEHRMVITDVRLLNRFDSLDVSTYPFLRYRTKYPPKKCHICASQPASRITVGDQLVPESPCLFCEQCFGALHRTKTGELHPSDLEVYPYTPDIQF